MSTHVLVAEDEAKIAELLSDYLEAAGMTVTKVTDGGAVEACVGRVQPDVLLLDVMLPNKDGMAICRDLRRNSDLPIIMLTARVEEIDRLLGLELGADDYVCKPFSPREVVARVKAVTRRASRAADEGRTAIDIDERTMRARIGDHRLDLTPVEFRLLAALLRHPGRVYRRDELLDVIYDDYRDVSDRTIDSHVKNLRRKIEAALPNQQLVHSVYGIGYKLELD